MAYKIKITRYFTTGNRTGYLLHGYDGKSTPDGLIDFLLFDTPEAAEDYIVEHLQKIYTLEPLELKRPRLRVVFHPEEKKN